MTPQQKKNLKEFKEKVPALNPIYAHEDEILDLRINGYSYAQIRMYLDMQYDLKTNNKMLGRICGTKGSAKVGSAKVSQQEPKDDESPASFFTKQTQK